ncbi:MAG: hypothetical protein SOH58_07685 [Olsenella sp.]|jgi:hypothetical protein
MELVPLFAFIVLVVVVGVAALLLKLSLKVIGWLVGAACTAVLLVLVLVQWIALA